VAHAHVQRLNPVLRYPLIDEPRIIIFATRREGRVVVHQDGIRMKEVVRLARAAAVPVSILVRSPKTTKVRLAPPTQVAELNLVILSAEGGEPTPVANPA